MKLAFAACALLACLQACTTAGPFVTNISNDGSNNLTVEKCLVHMNGFFGVMSTGECTSQNIKLLK